MADSVSPLTDSEYQILRGHLLEELLEPELSIDAATTAWILWTGCHPIVIAEPIEHNLQLDGDTVTWHRPKTGRYVRVPLVPELRPRAPVILEEFRARPRGTVQIWRQVKRTGERAGLSGSLGPRALRHTYISRVMQSSGNPYLTAQLAGTTYEVAQEYARYFDQAAVERMKKDGI